jgi:glycerol-1-phosphatase
MASHSAGARSRLMAGAARGYDGFIVDLDGVVWLGGRPIEGSAEALAKLRAEGVGLVFLTNDPQSSRDDYAARLSAIGVATTPDQVVTSAAATARFLARHERFAGAQVLAVGSAALRRELREAGLRLLPTSDARRARAVVVGAHRGFDYEELGAATTAVLAGAELFATGRDATYPTASGPRPATGAIVAAIETATGAAAIVLGKPQRAVFELARAALGDRERVAMIGDDLVADIAGAKRAGLDAILVLSGTMRMEDLDGVGSAAAVDPQLAPDLVFDDLAAVCFGRGAERSSVSTPPARPAPAVGHGGGRGSTTVTGRRRWRVRLGQSSEGLAQRMPCHDGTQFA